MPRITGTRVATPVATSRLTDKQWREAVQKQIRPTGAWGPDTKGSTAVPFAKLPSALKAEWNKMARLGEGEADCHRFMVAGRPAYLFSAYDSILGLTSFSLTDAHGKDIPLKADPAADAANARKVQDKFLKLFNSPAGKGWQGVIQKTDLGVLSDFSVRGTHLTPAQIATLPASVKKAIADEKAFLKAGATIDVWRSKVDQSLLIVGNSKHYEKTMHVIVSKGGTELGRQQIVD